MRPLNALILIIILLLCAACSREDAAIATAEQATNLTDLSQGQKIYNKNCGYCHTTGTLNAPVIGKKRDWNKPRQEGLEHLVGNAIFGIGQMEPRGGAHYLTDAEITLAVKYIIEKND